MKLYLFVQWWFINFCWKLVTYMITHFFFYDYLCLKRTLCLLFIIHVMYFKRGKSQKSICYLKLHSAYLNNFFKWTRVLNITSMLKLSKFSKVDIKQKNISTVILLINFFVYQWDPHNLQGLVALVTFLFTQRSPCSI